MKGNRNPPPPQPASTAAPLSPTSKGTAKYTNKDGSKFITVPKTSTPADSTQPSPTAASSPAPGAAPAQPVNRKKQKRRAKAAAKAAAEQAQSSQAANGMPSPPRSHDQQSADADHEDDEEEPNVGGSDAQAQQVYHNGVAQPAAGKAKKSKKKKKKNNTAGLNPEEPSSDSQYAQSSQGKGPGSVRPPPPPPHHDRPGMSKEKIWDTSSQEERERIKEFWLGLSESDRKSLVKVEKDAVLKKMKEQQKHTCSCTVCGRKRNAIEEELEGLYDAYYEELEQYANRPNQGEGEGPPMLRPRRSFNSMGGMRPRDLPSRYSNHQPSRGRIVEHVGEDEDEAGMDDECEGEGEEDYSEEELEDDEYSDDEQEASDDLHRSDCPADFFNFGNSLTVQGRDRLPILPSFLQSYPYPFSGAGNNAYGSSSLGGILTVADDLLKNDGKKFIEMMEQLAERRMAREEDAREQFERSYDHTNGDARYGHSHPQSGDEEEYDVDEDEEYEEEDDEEYDSQEEEVREPPSWSFCACRTESVADHGNRTR